MNSERDWGEENSHQVTEDFQEPLSLPGKHLKIQ